MTILRSPHALKGLLYESRKLQNLFILLDLSVDVVQNMQWGLITILSPFCPLRVTLCLDLSAGCTPGEK